MATQKQELWRSALGTNYPKEYMEKNEQRLYNELLDIRDLPENRTCADCGAKGTVLWASVNLGVFLCMTCGAHHRSLGTHISKPKGATGTYWWGEDEIAHMKSHGNARAKMVYGESVPPNGVTPDDPIKWKQYLTDKYVHKRYAPSPDKVVTPVLTKTPPSTPTKFSPQSSKNTKFTNVLMPDIGSIQFDIPKTPTVESKNEKTGAPIVSPTQDFFASFGL
ncbi:putative GTPase activating protein [Nitzschia inconspicua]|uniref:GTPase activating protein n=1 Tax=Nitzschia inconspicua TaxID=303405 RepID=A0A9K3KV59_9STRA|nr:putative GTPase activating protein [Nitzschia inconspicua]